MSLRDNFPDPPTVTLPEVDWQGALAPIAPYLWGAATVVAVALVVMAIVQVQAWRTRHRRRNVEAIRDVAHHTLGTRVPTEAKLPPEPTPGVDGCTDPKYRADRARWKIQAKAARKHHRATQRVDRIDVLEWDGDDPVDVVVEFPPFTNTADGARAREAFMQTWDARLLGPWEFSWPSGSDSSVRITRVPPPPELPEYVEWDSVTVDAQDRDSLYVGEAVDRPLVWNVEHHPHALVAGMTRSGKTVLVRSMVVQALRKSWLVDVVDVKRVDFVWVEGRPGVTGPAYSTAAALELLTAARDDLYARAEQMARHKVVKFSKWRDHPDVEVAATCPPRRFVVVDEAAAILSTKGITDDAEKEARQQAFDLLSDIAARGAGVGITLVVATQHPYAHTIEGVLRGNLDARFQAGALVSEQSGMVLEDRSVAKKLGIGGNPDADTPPRGRGVCRLDRYLACQYAFLDEDDVERHVPAVTTIATDDGDVIDVTDFDSPPDPHKPQPDPDVTRFDDPPPEQPNIDAIVAAVAARLRVDGDTPDVARDTADDSGWLAPGR